MKFPSDALLVLLKYARGITPLSPEVLEAAVEVLTYAWEMFGSNTWVARNSKSNNIVDCLEQALDEGKLGEDGATPHGFTPSIWMSIGFWILTKILKQIVTLPKA